MKDWFDSVGKRECRLGNLRVASSVRELWDKKTGELKCRWCELAGDSVELSIEILGTAVSPSNFVGVDKDEDKIRKYMRSMPDRKWIRGDIYSAVSRLRRLDIGVLNLDGYGNAGREGASLQAVMPLVSDGVHKFGAFLLILNRSLDGVRRRGIRPSEALREQAKRVCDVASSKHGRPEENILLPEGAELAVDDPSFSGEVGAFHVYKGRTQRMANLRIIF